MVETLVWLFESQMHEIDETRIRLPHCMFAARYRVPTGEALRFSYDILSAPGPESRGRARKLRLIPRSARPVWFALAQGSSAGEQLSAGWPCGDASRPVLALG
jgi:hypothetical protein